MPLDSTTPELLNSIKIGSQVTAYAHTHPAHPDDPTKWEPLFTPFGNGPDDCSREDCEKCRTLDPNHGHLNKVAWWCAKFASEMFPPGPNRDAARQWGYLAGLWHDLGKFSQEFQKRLQGTSESVDHSTGGARHASRSFPYAGQLLAYLIAGHHASLADWNQNGSRSDLQKRLELAAIPDWEANTPPDLTLLPAPPWPRFLNPKRPNQVAFFTRLLFSCLVDADFLATEAFMNAREHQRRPDWPSDMIPRMETALSGHFKRAFGSVSNEIHKHRETVRSDCLVAAEKPSGLFTLTVPTGGGKTLSSLAFALRHAVLNHFERIIYVIPYTSIIEQNAKVFRDAFQELAATLPEELRPHLVLEHHSNFDPPASGGAGNEKPVWKLAAENWDAPLVVTTSVQFFESLYANKTSRCRKIHNLARAVIILDEAQNLPVELLAPCLDSLRNLTKLAGSSVVLCTATQPAVGSRPAADDPFNRIALELPADGSREIIRNVPALFAAFRRVRISNHGILTDESLVRDLLRCHQRVLCILNTKRHATKVFEQLGADEPQNLHLSAQLCPAHRQSVMNEIRVREIEDQPCRVIATTVVEAGVDLDFPVVCRALAGLDSLAQAAGRCNRHGKLGPDGGCVVMFTPAEEKVPAFMIQNVNSTRQTLPDFEPARLLDPEAIESYFRSYFWLSGGQCGRGWDKHGIQNCFTSDFSEPAHPFTFNFKTAASDFQIIPDTQAPVIIEPVPGLWPGQDEAASATIRQLLNEIRECHRKQYPPPLDAHRTLQRYTVQIPKNIHATMVAEGHIQVYHERFPILTHPQNLYDSKLGLLIPDHLDKPGAFII